MADSTRERIAELLAEGLERYGDGDVARAILAWQEVLVLDPEQQEARDYLATADRRSQPRGPGDDPAAARVALEARDMLREGRVGEALEWLQVAVDRYPQSLDLQATFDLVRARLLEVLRRQAGDPDAVPCLRPDAPDPRRYNLPPDAGFLLSMIDGRTSLSDLVSLSGMDDFEALRLVVALRESGLVELSG